MEAKQYATEQQMDHWRIQKENQKIPRDKWKWKHNDQKSLGHSKINFKREVYSNKIFPQETAKTSNKQFKLTPKATRGRGTSKTQS